VGRVGEPADVAEAYLYLVRGGCSAGSVVTGDGGGTLVRGGAGPARTASPSHPTNRTSPTVTTVPSRGKSSRTDASCSAGVNADMASSTKTRS